MATRRRKDPWQQPFDLDMFAKALGYDDFMAALARRGKPTWDENRDGERPERWFMNEDGWQFMVRHGMLWRQHWWCLYDNQHPDGKLCELQGCTVYSIQADRMPSTVAEAFAIVVSWVDEVMEDTPEDRAEFLEQYQWANSRRFMPHLRP
jgi:hypothetical protein